MEGQAGTPPAVDTGAAQETTSQTTETQVTQTNDAPVNPLLEWMKGGNEEVTATEPVTEPVTQTEPELIMGKFKSQDELIADYTAKQAQLEQLPQLQQQFEAQKQQLEMMQSLIQSQKPAEPVKQEEPELTPEQIAEMNQAMQDKMYNDPIGFANEIKAQAQAEAMKQIQPLLQEREMAQKKATWDNTINQLYEANQQEFDALKPAMQKITQQLGDMLSKMPPDIAAQKVYDMAKSTYVPPVAPPAQKTPQEMLADPEFQKLVMADPNISKMIIQQYAGQIKAGQPPVTIGGQAGGQIPATAGNSPKSAREAYAMHKAYVQSLQ